MDYADCLYPLPEALFHQHGIDFLQSLILFDSIQVPILSLGWSCDTFLL